MRGEFGFSGSFDVGVFCRGPDLMVTLCVVEFCLLWHNRLSLSWFRVVNCSYHYVDML